MKLTSVVFGLVALAVSLSAQTITVVNTANSVLTPSSVVGDPVIVTITGAAANSLVTMTYSYNGASNLVWNAGYTGDNGDGTGNWTVTGFSPYYQIGTWFEQWAVGGTNIGANFNFQIFDMPTSLSAVSALASSPDECGSTYKGGNPTYTFGPSAKILYQIIGSTGSNETALALMMTPVESGIDYAPNGTVTNVWPAAGQPKIPVGTDDTTFPWHPPSAANASTSGTFTDVPISLCLNTSFASFKEQVQNIYIVFGNHAPYQVRSNTWYGGAGSSGHGTLSNLSDVNYTQ